MRDRYIADHGEDGLGGVGWSPAVGGMTEDDEKLLKATLDGIPKDWEKVWPRYDQRHWMQNLATVLSVEQGELHARHALRLRRVAPLLPRCSPPPLTAKGTPIYNLFMSLVFLFSTICRFPGSDGE